MNIGIIVNNLGVSDRNIALISCLNTMVMNDRLNPIVFPRTIRPYPVSPTFSIMGQNEIFNFSGILIATDIETAKLCLSNHNACKKIYYLWDLDWIFTSQPNYNNNAEIFLNPNLDFVVRSTDHAKIFRKVWGKTIHVVEEFEYEQLRKFIKRVANV
jgi:hypothetical protein